MSDQVKAYDRTLGILITLSGSLAFLAIRNWIQQKNLTRGAGGEPADEIHSVRYALLEKLTHHGACHCERVRFRIRAPRVLNAFDIKSKIRFPRLILKCEDFENVSDENNLSLYAVTNGNQIGIHAFCSYCGVHILFSPAEDPKEIQVNVECLDQTSIEKINISYSGKSDSIACDLSDARARLYSRTRHQEIRHPVDVPLPPPISRTPSRGPVLTPHHEMSNPQHQVILDNDSCSETVSELIVEGIDDQIGSQNLLELRNENGEHHHLSNGSVPISRHTKYSHWSEYPRDWSHEITYNSPSPADSADSSNTTSESYPGNSRLGYEDRREDSSIKWNQRGGDTPTAALHRRLRTFLHRHMPQSQHHNTTSISNGSSSPSRLPAYPQRVDSSQYDTYETVQGQSRWRR